MPLFQPSLLRYATNTAFGARRAAREALRARTASTCYPVIPTCPSPTCDCGEMPSDLDIEKKIDLNGTMAPYSEHLIIPSGQADWTSKIEDEKDTAPWGEFTANVKRALSQKGDYHDPYHNVVVSTVSFEPPPYDELEPISSALLFPSFRMVDKVKTSTKHIPEFVRTFLLPNKLHPSYDQLSEEEKSGKRRDISRMTSKHWAGKVRPISTPTILICSHNSRDTRCGILGPLLHAEFSQYINKRHTLRNAASNGVEEATGVPRTFACHPTFSSDVIDSHRHDHSPVNIGMISHIGGHKFAGNVIIYIPPDYHCQPVERESRGTKPKDVQVETSGREQDQPIYDDEPLDSVNQKEADITGLSPLAGKGIWYGRVEPKHVEGIVEQTIGHGKIIRELFRGGINADGSSIRLSLY